MAKRPVFTPRFDTPFVKESLVEFQWHPGLSVSQKQKSIKDLHTAISNEKLAKKTLEISSKSTTELGIALSAFNLEVELNNQRKVKVENIFQASKIFENGGPFLDLLYCDPLSAKRDIRLKESGNLTGFKGKGFLWPTEPKTIFYDWIYINALYKNPDLSNQLLNYDSFTDIEFNPTKSFSCQARSAAIFVALTKLEIIEKILESPEYFINEVSEFDDEKPLQKVLI